MSKLAQDQLSLLLEVEKEFARRVVYLMRAYTPKPWWHIFIPFKFVMEYISLRKEKRDFTEKHLLFKRMALEAAFHTVESGKPEENKQEMHSKLKEFWFQNQQIESGQLYERLVKMIDLLLEHYIRLMKTGERDYGMMIRKAYGLRADYQNFFDRMERVEAEIDRALVEALGLKWPDLYMQIKQRSIKEVRSREVRETFKGLDQV